MSSERMEPQDTFGDRSLMSGSHKAHTLEDFIRNTIARIERLQDSGHPEILTVDGKPCLVVQGAESYQQMVALIESWDTAESAQMTRLSLAQVKAGEKGMSVEEMDAKLDEKYGFNRQKESG